MARRKGTDADRAEASAAAVAARASPPDDRPGRRGEGAAARGKARGASGAAGAAGPRGRPRPRGSLLGRLRPPHDLLGLRRSASGAASPSAGSSPITPRELPGASEWRVPDRPPNIQILAVDGTADRQSRRHRRRGGPHRAASRTMCRTRSSPSRTGASARISASTRSGLVRAVAKNAFAGDVVQGGSTLTQQLAKNMFLTPERSLKRKVQEVVLAVWLETKYSKDEILEMYLNRVYFGAGAYGIDAAARRYFDREATRADAAAGGDARRPAAGAEPLRAEPQPGSGAGSAPRSCSTAMRAAGLHLRGRGGGRRATTRPQAASLHMSRSENYVADWVMDVLPFHLGSIEQDVVVETTRRPRPAGAGRAGARSIRSTRRARNTASSEGAHGGGRRHRRGARHGRRPLLRAEPVQPRRRRAAASRAPPSSPSSI